MSAFRIPTLCHSDVIVELAEDPEMIDGVNRLIFRNYVAAGFWEDNEGQMYSNKFLHAPTRRVFTITQSGQLIGTMSVVKDSDEGLPSDSAQPAAMRRLRAKGGNLAEVSAFAMDRSKPQHRNLVFLLMSYMYQYSFYYAGVDRLVASCGSGHTGFYESILCFSRLSGPTYYPYTRDVGCLLTLDLHEAHSLFSEKYPPDPVTGDSFYRFMLCDPHPCHKFDTELTMSRPRPIRASGSDFARAA